jgi:hypothetical protein
VTQLDVEGAGVKAGDFIGYGKGLPVSLPGIGFFGGEQQDFAGGRQDLAEMLKVIAANFIRQSGERSAVENGRDVTKVGSAELEEIATENADATVLPQRKFSDPATAGLYPVFAEKGASGERAEFNTDDRMPLLGEPEQIKAFTAERNENPVARRQSEAGPEPDQMRIDGFLMEGRFPVAPGLLPEFVIASGHGDFFL